MDSNKEPQIVSCREQFNDEDSARGKSKIFVLRKYPEHCILALTRGVGPRALQEWLQKQLEDTCFLLDAATNTCNTRLLARDAVLVHPHYSAYARSLVLVARDKAAQRRVKQLQLTTHCLCQGKFDKPNETILKGGDKLDEKTCLLSVRSMEVAHSNTAGYISLVSATNVVPISPLSSSSSSHNNNTPAASAIQPRQFRRQLKAAHFPVLGNSKDCEPFRGESMCVSVVALHFETTCGGGGLVVQDSVRIDPAPRLRAVLEREERFWREKAASAPALLDARKSDEDDNNDGSVLPIPVAYLVGTTEFDGLTFSVNPSVMIPRPSSLSVVQSAMSLYKETKEQPGAIATTTTRSSPLVLDLGTGSGCLLLSILHRLPEAKGIGIDKCPKALAVARHNASALGLHSRCELKEGDFSQLSSRNAVSSAGERVDIVVCNPPYHSRVGRLASDLAHEPSMALFVDRSRNDMCVHYQDVLLGLRNAALTKEGTVLAFEVFKDNSKRVADLMIEHGLEKVKIGRDRHGCIRTSSGIYPKP